MKKVITVETWRKTVLHRQRQKKSAWCEMCAAQVEMLSTDQAASICGSTELTIFRQVENGKLHFTETPEGNLLICSSSLTNKELD
jgi:Zn finger protein HypA/HybF involved in hydrogenase expression